MVFLLALEDILSKILTKVLSIRKGEINAKKKRKIKEDLLFLCEEDQQSLLLLDSLSLIGICRGLTRGTNSVS